MTVQPIEIRPARRWRTSPPRHRSPRQNLAPAMLGIIGVCLAWSFQLVEPLVVHEEARLAFMSVAASGTAVALFVACTVGAERVRLHLAGLESQTRGLAAQVRELRGEPAEDEREQVAA